MTCGNRTHRNRLVENWNQSDSMGFLQPGPFFWPLYQRKRGGQMSQEVSVLPSIPKLEVWQKAGRVTGWHCKRERGRGWFLLFEVRRGVESVRATGLLRKSWHPVSDLEEKPPNNPGTLQEPSWSGAAHFAPCHLSTSRAEICSVGAFDRISQWGHSCLILVLC